MSRGQRQQSGPPVTTMPTLLSHQLFAVTDKVNRLLTLSRDAHEELDFRVFGNSRGQRTESKYTSTSVVPSLSSRRNTSRGFRWVTRLLPSRTPVDSGSYQQVQPGGVTPDGALEMVRQRFQWNELKRIILVSPRWCRDTSETN